MTAQAARRLGIDMKTMTNEQRDELEREVTAIIEPDDDYDDGD